MKRSILYLFWLCLIFMSCKTGSIVTYDNPDFVKDKLYNFQINKDLYITADIKYVVEDYGIIFHVYSSKDSFENLIIQSLKLIDESGVLFETNDEINVLVTSGKSFFDSSTNLYQRSFLISCCHLSSQEIQQRKKFYTLEYFIKNKQKIEKLIRKEEKYLITST